MTDDLDRTEDAEFTENDLSEEQQAGVQQALADGDEDGEGESDA